MRLLYRIVTAECIFEQWADDNLYKVSETKDE